MGEIAFVTWRNGGQNARTTTRAIASKIAQRKSIEEAIAPRARAALDGAISGRRRGSKPTPPVILRFGVDVDLSGAVTTFQPNVATFTFNNAFFRNLGTNGRTCFSCHQPQSGWAISADGVAERFVASGGTDPIFRLVDGATCPSDDVCCNG